MRRLLILIMLLAVASAAPSTLESDSATALSVADLSTQIAEDNAAILKELSSKADTQDVLMIETRMDAKMEAVLKNVTDSNAATVRIVQEQGGRSRFELVTIAGALLLGFAVLSYNSAWLTAKKREWSA